jgi:hypothetical protein
LFPSLINFSSTSFPSHIEYTVIYLTRNMLIEDAKDRIGILSDLSSSVMAGREEVDHLLQGLQWWAGGIT